jgi:hypothetical protein
MSLFPLILAKVPVSEIFKKGWGGIKVILKWNLYE